ncbi:hypothetical protein TWF718_003526 [Orbilia javanica]|uniref:Zn(2)-C6 fungal-type domain-containing protein n=1 Tax=Orbilia javanica TaxID=47235 RepID=A0AAN8MEW8_9PEZI
MEKRSAVRKLRKVRKGTQSCWECKRRKIRCSFATPRSSICDGCKSRGTRCIGQEYEDGMAQESALSGQRNRGGSFLREVVHQDNCGPESVAPQIGRDLDESGSSTACTLNPSPNPENTDLENITRALILEWPKESDLDLILGIPVGASTLLHGLICRPYAELFAENILSPQDVLQPPLEVIHPVLVARKLLLLATFLQSIPLAAAEKLAGMSSHYLTVMSHVFNAATRLVTSNDDLITTLEGIECVMMESMYLNNAGNLRRAWLANRRAMGIAQMMRLHVNATSQPNITLEKETRDRIDPKYMWFRLVVSDRYLSLMLGLPQGTVENSFAESQMLDKCTPLERMERMESVAASLILRRDNKERIDLLSTHKIDTMLRDAAALMPPRWWLADTKLTSLSGDDTEALQESVRLTAQFAHYHLLAQLHLPYILLRSSKELNYDYNKTIAANSSREVLTRFVAYRSSSSTPAYCRGIDFISFIASVTLCLAHMQAMNSQAVGPTCATFQSLQHQRLSDRGLLEVTLEIMETMASENNDAVARKISSILRPLLNIESNSLQGGCYHISASPDTDAREPQPVGDFGEATNGVSIHIPHFGTIKIEHRTTLTGQSSADPQIPTLIDSNSVVAMDHSTGGKDNTTRLAEHEYTAQEPLGMDWQAATSFLEARAPLHLNEGLIGPATAGPRGESLPVPSLGVELDDWVLQGVDLALFNSLTTGDFNFMS